MQEQLIASAWIMHGDWRRRQRQRRRRSPSDLNFKKRERELNSESGAEQEFVLITFKFYHNSGVRKAARARTPKLRGHFAIKGTRLVSGLVATASSLVVGMINVGARENPIDFHKKPGAEIGFAVLRTHSQNTHTRNMQITGSSTNHPAQVMLINIMCFIINTQASSLIYAMQFLQMLLLWII